VAVELGAQRGQVQPDVVGVEEPVALGVLEGVEVLVGRLGHLAQHEPAALAPPGDVAALLVGLGAVDGLHENGMSSPANQASVRGSSTAPRLSEFETNA
jgi:hypothetical protein